MNDSGTPSNPPMTFTYRNWRGEVTLRRVIPHKLWYGSTAWHPEPQWFMQALDLEKNELRDFAMRDINCPPDAHQGMSPNRG